MPGIPVSEVRTLTVHVTLVCNMLHDLEPSYHLKGFWLYKLHNLWLFEPLDYTSWNSLEEAWQFAIIYTRFFCCGNLTDISPWSALLFVVVVFNYSYWRWIKITLCLGLFQSVGQDLVKMFSWQNQKSGVSAWSLEKFSSVNRFCSSWKPPSRSVVSFLILLTYYKFWGIELWHYLVTFCAEKKVCMYALAVGFFFSHSVS
jgi:hypothetical protein